MKILFVASGNKSEGISPIIYAQLTSLTDQGVQVDIFTINGKGFNGYLEAILPLRKKLLTNNYNLVHAHYSLSGIVAALAGSKFLVVSLMGSDLISSRLYRYLILFFKRFFWDKLIVKSFDMKENISLPDAEIVPNGVNLLIFQQQNKFEAQKELGWDPSKKHILFPSDPSRPEKNYKLFREAKELLSDRTIMAHSLFNAPHTSVPIYLNASDVIVLTSLYEGSPNVIKEAMACNCPIVSTEVGDVKWILEDTDGCYISKFNTDDVAEKIRKALDFGQRTNGRDRIINLGLDSIHIAEKIISIYNNVIMK